MAASVYIRNVGHGDYHLFLLVASIVAIFALIPVLILTSTPARAEDLVVTNPGDSGDGTLRDAIIRANTNGEPDRITFAGDMRIFPLTTLPILESPDPVTIDAEGHTVVIDGSLNLDLDFGVLARYQDNLTIRGLRIVNLDASGLVLLFCSNTHIYSCYMGTSDGSTPESNIYGIHAWKCTDLTIGEAGFGNTISGNSYIGLSVHECTNVSVKGNKIGLNSAGTSELWNWNYGINSSLNTNLTIGGSSPGEGNLLSVNSVNLYCLVDVSSSGVTLLGNNIGADVTGEVEIGVGSVYIAGSSDVRIGDGTSGGRNLECGYYCRMYQTKNVSVRGNYFGVNRDGTKRLGNDGGILVQNSTDDISIGGSSPGDGNVMQRLHIKSSSGIVVSGNHVGVNASGDKSIGTVAGGDTSMGVLLEESDYCLVGGGTSREANVISGNDIHGVTINSGENNTVAGNLIGTDASGRAAVPNGYNGVMLTGNSRNNVIGGDSPSARNVISGNGNRNEHPETFSGGVHLFGDVTNNVVMGNYIGVASDGSSPLPNQGYGVSIGRGSANRVGGVSYWGYNTIAHNTRSGICVAADGGEAKENRILENRVHSNGGLGIDLSPEGPNVPQENFPYPTAGKPNLWMHFPVITYAVQTPGETMVEGTAVPDSIVYLYTSDSGAGRYGEGKDYMRSATVEPSGFFRFSGLSIPAGSWITATAMDAGGNTSEFCLNAIVTDMAPPTGSISIEHGAPQTAEREVKLYPVVYDNSSPPEKTQMLISEDPAFSGASWEPFASERIWTLSEGLGKKTVYARYMDEAGNISDPCSASIELVEAIPPPTISPVWYFAEGCTREPFEEWIYIYNPNDVKAHIEATCISPQGNSSRSFDIHPKYRNNLFLDYYPESDDRDVSTVIHATDTWGNDLGVVCERTMYKRKAPGDPPPRKDFSGHSNSIGMDWSDAIDGHCSVGATRTSKTWYFAEGCTGYGFETWFLLLNPTDTEANVTVSFFTDEGGRVDASVTLPPMSRTSLRASNHVPNANFSARIESEPGIVAERSMYWEGGRGDSCSLGAEKPSETWYTAEGSTAWGFDQYLLVFNPAAERAELELSLLGKDGPGPTREIEVDAGSRKTIHLNEVFPDSDCAVALESKNGVEVVCERAMYWDGGGRRSGHCSVACPEPKRDWYLSEGYNDLSVGFEGYLLIANPTDQELSVKIVLNTPGGETDWKAIPRIRPHSRVTFPLSGFKGRSQMCFQVHVMDEDPEKKVVVERSMYWCDKYGGHEGMGYAP